MNKIIIIGNLGSDPEVREINGKQQLLLSVAVRRNFKNKEGQYDSDWFRVVDYYDQRIKFVTDHFHKGDGIVVEGSVRTGSFTKQDGTKGYSFDIYPTAIEFGPGRRGADAEQRRTPQTQAPTQTATAPLPAALASIPKGSDTEETLPWS